MENYRTVLGNQQWQGEFIEKKSRFIATVMSVTSLDQATSFIADIKSRYKDATHNCTAFVLKDGVMRFSDDGEPSGTAGKHILDVLLKEELVDIAVVITRYYGGIQLGAGGLARAYTTATKTGIDSSQIARMCLGKRVNIHTDYNTIGKILYQLEQDNIQQQDSQYTDIISITATIPAEYFTDFVQKITEISAGKSTVEELEEIFFPKAEQSI